MEIITLKTDPKVSFELIDDKEKGNLVLYNGQLYTDLKKLIEDSPSLSEIDNVESFVDVANYLFFGKDFTLLKDAEMIDRYKQAYLNVYTKVIPDLIVLDISKLGMPSVVGEQVVFYAEDANTHIPYCAKCTFPYIGPEATCHYEVLPALLEH